MLLKPEPKGPFAHTYSIVAYDPDTGEIGGAVQSHWFSVGSIVLWGEAGVGMVATQSFTNPRYGPKGLELLRGGMAPRSIVAEMTGQDEGREMRQLAVIDSKGSAAAHTGARCVPQCGHIVGKDFSVQANMMASSTVWPAMAAAFEKAEGPLAERLVAALEAAEQEGGDYRGRQSAALLVVRGDPTGMPWVDRAVDLRVEDHSAPVPELKRLLRVHRAYQNMNEGDSALERNDLAEALEKYGAAQEMYPQNEEMSFWCAAALAGNGRLEEAFPMFSRAFAGNPRWREAIPDLVRLGHLKLSEKDMKRVLDL